MTRRRATVALAPAVLLAALAGCSATAPVRPAPETCPDCVDARRVNGWCERCAHGHVAGIVIPSAALHEAIDAHGHEIDPSRMLCLECAEMLERDGFCTRCRYGFVGGQLFFTELTWSLHRGAVVLAEDLECPGCFAVHGTTGTCDRCGTRWAGNVAFTDPELHAIAIRELDRLRTSIALLDRCEYCAIGAFFGAGCPKHDRGREPESGNGTGSGFR